MSGILRLVDALAHFAADKIEAHNAASAAERARIREQFAKDKETIAGDAPATKESHEDR